MMNKEHFRGLSSYYTIMYEELHCPYEKNSHIVVKVSITLGEMCQGG